MLSSLFIVMASFNTITKVLCKIFLKLVHFVAVLPDRNDKANFIFYFKLFVTVSIQTGFVYKAHQYRSEHIYAIAKLVRFTYLEKLFQDVIFK